MPKVFGKEHLIYIAASLIVAALCIYINKKFATTEKRKLVAVKLAAAILYLIIFSNRLTLVFEHGLVNWKMMIPDTFCCMSSYLLSIFVLFGRKNNNVLHFIWLLAFVGGTITTFYPDFIGQNPSFWYPPTLLGMMHHTWAAILVILILMNGFLTLTYKKWYCTPIGFAAFLSYGAFLICVLGFENPFYMTAPVFAGTFLTVWGIAPIYLAVYPLILLAVELIRKHRASRLGEDTKGK